MNPEIKTLLLRALRSDKYKQGKGRLRDGDKFCCLGVVCDLHSLETGNKWEGNVYLESEHTLPLVVAQWAGFKSHNPDVKNEFACLAAMNDAGESFKKIARVIEKQL